jgi:hypothetical protein
MTARRVTIWRMRSGSGISFFLRQRIAFDAVEILPGDEICWE